MVSVRLYPGSVTVVADDQVVAHHERLSDVGGTHYDWQHYIPLIQRKPGALRNGAPFADMPEALQQLRRALLRHPCGDRVLAQVLAQVPQAGLEAVIVAAELALESSPLRWASRALPITASGYAFMEQSIWSTPWSRKRLRARPGAWPTVCCTSTW
jgi:hypothetical protein